MRVISASAAVTACFVSPDLAANRSRLREASPLTPPPPTTVANYCRMVV